MWDVPFLPVSPLIYLAIQVRQNAGSVRASIEQSTAEFIAQVTLNISATPGLSGLIGRAMSDPSELDEEEFMRAWSWLLAALRAYEQAHHQYLEGNVSAGIWNGMNASIIALFKAKFVHELWSARQSLFNPRFQNYINALDLSSGPDSPAVMVQKSMGKLANSD